MWVYILIKMSYSCTFYFKIKEICSIWLLFQHYSWFFYHPVIPKIMLAYWPHPYS